MNDSRRWYITPEFESYFNIYEGVLQDVGLFRTVDTHDWKIGDKSSHIDEGLGLFDVLIVIG